VAEPPAGSLAVEADRNIRKSNHPEEFQASVLASAGNQGPNLPWAGTDAPGSRPCHRERALAGRAPRTAAVLPRGPACAPQARPSLRLGEAIL